MTGTLVVVVFGFPAIFVSLLVSALGVIKDKYGLVVLGAILFIPFSYYLNGAAHGSGLPLLLPLFQAGSAAAVHYKDKLWAWILLTPALLVSLYVVFVVLFLRIR
jgi:hypothetical protein